MSAAADTIENACRVCGCTWDNACRDKSTSTGGCYWVIAQSRRGTLICNVCDEKVRAIKLPRDTRDSLNDLVAQRAYDRRTAKLGPGGAGLRHSQALARRGLIESEYARAAGRMVYWATPLGREVARRG